MPFSFPVYLLHEYPMTTVMRLIALAHFSLVKAIILFFVMPIFVILICVLVIMLWKRILPRTYAFCTGGR